LESTADVEQFLIFAALIAVAMAAYDEPAAKTVEEAAPAEPVVKLEQL
jgi:hypothetical protein